MTQKKENEKETEKRAHSIQKRAPDESLYKPAFKNTGIMDYAACLFSSTSKWRLATENSQPYFWRVPESFSSYWGA